jgi:hypothetical protein
MKESESESESEVLCTDSTALVWGQDISPIFKDQEVQEE